MSRAEDASPFVPRAAANYVGGADLVGRRLPVGPVRGAGILTRCSGRTVSSASRDPMVNEPAGTNTISGHSRQSLNSFPSRISVSAWSCVRYPSRASKAGRNPAPTFTMRASRRTATVSGKAPKSPEAFPPCSLPTQAGGPTPPCRVSRSASREDRTQPGLSPRRRCAPALHCSPPTRHQPRSAG